MNLRECDHRPDSTAAMNGCLANSREFICSECLKTVWQAVDSGTYPLCSICNWLSESTTMSPDEKDLIRRHLNRDFAAPAVTAPTPMSASSAYAWCAIENLVVAVSITVALCVVITFLVG